LVPLVSALGLLLPALVGGSVVIEKVFGIRGMGLLALESVLRRDYPLALGITTLVALATMVASLFADLLYAAVDPRIRLGRAR
jgi:peptide/nickel transport system permease protein